MLLRLLQQRSGRQALQTLSRADTNVAAQKEAQQAWKSVVSEGSAKQLTEILAVMKGVGPLADNWLRAAVDTIAERELSNTGQLPAKALEEFLLDVEQGPRARRVAYEWLAKVDATAPDRLLPKLLDDSSLELRYDAIERLLAEAKESNDDPEKLKKYQRALRSAREKGQLKACAEGLKELGQEPNMAEQMGFLTQWKVVGPFDNTDRAGFDQVFPPEQSVDFNEQYTGKSGAVQWKEVEAEQEDLEAIGIVDLNKALVEEKSVLAYAVATVNAPKDLQVECRYESKEATKLWVNGREVAVKNVYHSGDGFDQYIVPCKLKRGENQILIKVCQNEQTEPWTKPWDFRLRVTDRLGGAILPSK